MNKEKRFYSDVSIRADKEGNERFIEGYGAVFNVRSKLIYENDEFFYEEIRNNAFDDILSADNMNVILTFQHNRNSIIGRFTKRDGKIVSNTLELSVDDKGLKFRSKIPNTTQGNDVYELIQRGDLYECSFIFTVSRDGYRWEDVEELDEKLRIVERINGLYDVSIVIDGAYSTTDVEVAAREHLNMKKKEEENSTEKKEERNMADILRMRTKLIELKK